MTTTHGGPIPVILPDRSVLPRGINNVLVKEQGLTEEDVAKISAGHVIRHYIYEAMERTDVPEELKRLNSIATEIENYLQTVWKFGVNPNMHRWYNVPKCRCPKMDNEEALGTPYRTHSGLCPIHWPMEEPKSDWNSIPSTEEDHILFEWNKEGFVFPDRGTEVLVESAADGQYHVATLLKMARDDRKDMGVFSNDYHHIIDPIRWRKI
jgi:hypothetical protein